MAQPLTTTELLLPCPFTILKLLPLCTVPSAGCK